MTSKVTYKIGNSSYEYVFEEFCGNLRQGWEPEQYPLKNPFTKRRGLKKFGVYYNATVPYSSIPYLELNLNIRKFLGKDVTDIYFYPDKNSPERYEVDVSSNISFEDDAPALEYTDVEINFLGKVCFPTPLNHALGYAGDRSHTILQLANYTIAELSGE